MRVSSDSVVTPFVGHRGEVVADAMFATPPDKMEATR